jgi:hypothetical protein
MSRTAKMSARPTDLTKLPNPHTEVWTRPLANCTVAWRLRSFHLCQSRCQGSSSQGFSEGKNHRQATSSFLVKTSLLSPILTLPLSSPTLLSIHLSLYLASHDHPSITSPHSLERHLINLPLSAIYHHRRVFPTSRRDKLHQSIQHQYYHHHHHLIILHFALRIDCSN